MCSGRQQGRQTTAAQHWPAFSTHLMLLENVLTEGGADVCPSIVLVSHSYAVQDIKVIFTLYDTAIFPVS